MVELFEVFGIAIPIEGVSLKYPSIYKRRKKNHVSFNRASLF